MVPFRSMLGLALTLAALLIAGASAASKTAADDEAEIRKALDQKFETLLAAAQKDPKKTDWQALRLAFSHTSHYQPYNAAWGQECTRVVMNLRDNKLKQAEDLLTKMLERERFMRIEAHAMAVEIYEKTADPEKAQEREEKARKHKEFLEGLSSVVFARDRGTSFEKPIEVLFIEEEYFVVNALGCKVKQQALTSRDGHSFDVLTLEAKPGEPERQLFFNIDIPWSFVQGALKNAADQAKPPDAKK
jgi:hypothetical protein